MTALKSTHDSRRCATCGIAIFGRSDKKYCSDQCRTIGNSDNRLANAEKIKQIDKALRLNHRILRHLCPAGKTIVTRVTLAKAGFDFNHFTTIYPTKSNTIYFVCYDYAFAPVMRDSVESALIVKYTIGKDFDPWKFKNH